MGDTVTLDDGRLLSRASMGISGLLHLVAEHLPDGHDQLRLWLHDVSDRPNGFLGIDLRGLPGKESQYVEKLTSRLEYLSRNEFVESLRRAGFSGAPNRNDVDITLPGSIAGLLNEMSFVPQFSAIRQLHQLIREKGESPQLLGGLARGYANLGVLTEDNYSAAHKAFKARALLYAERMVVAAPKSAQSHWCRAYVQTLIGRLGPALKELALAETLPKGSGSESVPPPWVNFLTAVCKHDDEKLEAIIDHPTHAPLARLLRMTISTQGVATLQFDEAARTLEVVPDCYRAIATMYKHGPLGIKRQLAYQSPMVVADNLYRRLSEIPSLPKDAQHIIDNYRAEALNFDNNLPAENEDRLQLVRALHRAGATRRDSGELSWGVLGQLILEVTFLQAWQHVDFERNALGVPVEDSIDALLPLIADHPYQRFLETFSKDRSRIREAQKALEETMVFREIELRQRQLGDHFYYSGNRKSYDRAISRARSQYDECLGDLIARAQSVSKTERSRWARRLLRVAPRHPFSVAMAIQNDWREIEGRKDELENHYKNSAAVQGALGKKFDELKLFDAAERCLNRQVELNPDLKAYTTLANFYKKKGDDEAWLAVLEEFLEIDRGLGLEGTNVRVQIARHFMNKKEWETAKPYAYRAAESYAAWALNCGRDCAEGLGDLETAEQFSQAVAQRYDGQQVSWYLWCKRFNFGNLEAARDLALQHLQSIQEPTARQWFDVYATFHLLDENLLKALEGMEKSFRQSVDPYVGLHLAIIADEVKKPQVRSNAIKQIAERGKEYRHNYRIRFEMIEIAKILQEVWESNGKLHLDLGKVEEILKKAPADEKTDIDYFVGRFLLKHGQTRDAEAYLERAAKSGNYRFNRAFAAALLHQRGINFRERNEEPAK